MRLSYLPAGIVIAALLASTAYFYHHESSFLSPMKVASGTVAAFGNRSNITTTINGVSNTRGTQALVDFSVEGMRYRTEGRAVGLPNWQLGQTVDVHYLPGDPLVSRISRADEIYFFTLLSAFFLVAMLICGAISFIFASVRNKRMAARL